MKKRVNNDRDEAAGAALKIAGIILCIVVVIVILAFCLVFGTQGF